MFRNSREVRVNEFFDDEGDLALEDGVEELHNENQTHAQNDECDDQDDDSRRRVAHVPLREQRFTCKSINGFACNLLGIMRNCRVWICICSR